MEYQVPQFIEVEDKIFGPLTLRQFIFLAGGAGICAGLILYVKGFFGILLAAPVAMFALALAFYKVNNKSFLDLLEAGATYYAKGRLYLWKKEDKPAAMAVQAPPAAAQYREKLGLSRGKLKDLAWSLDIQDRPAETNP